MANPVVLFGPNNRGLNLQTGIVNNPDGTLNKNDGPKNYLPDVQNGSLNGWQLATVTLSSGVPTGSITASAASITTFAPTASGAISDTYSLQVAAGTSLTAGQGFCSPVLTIDTADQAKVLTYKGYYSTTVGASSMNFSGTSSNTWALWFLDNNGTWFQPSGCYGMTQSSGVGYITATFQTASNTTSVQAVWLCVNAVAAPVTMLFGRQTLGPQTAPIGPVVTDWVSYTPTGAWVSNTTYSGWWRRNGSNLEVTGRIDLSGAPTAANLTVNLPSGLVIDTSRIQANGLGTEVGLAMAVDAGNNNYPAVSLYNTTTSVALYISNASVTYGTGNFINSTVPFSFGSGDLVSFSYSVPITGWSSNVQMSNDTDTRIVDFVGTQSSQAVTANVTNLALTTVKDSHGAWNGTQYVVAVAGDYIIGGSAVASGTASSVAYKNGSSVQNITTIASGVAGGGSLLIPNCVPGDLLSVRFGTSVTITAGYFYINRLSGPSVIAATESVNAKYQFAAGGSPIPNNTTTNLTSTYVTYNKIKDTHALFNTTTGVYGPIGVPGTYQVMLKLTLQPTTATSGRAVALVTQAGSASQTSEADLPFGTTVNTTVTVIDDFNCLSGDTITLQGFQNNSSNTLSVAGGNSLNSFTIKRIGN